MANYPQIDDCSGVWKLKDVNDAVMGGYWRVGGTRALFGGGNQGDSNVIDFITIVISKPLIFSTLSKFTSGKTICSFIPKV